MTITVVVADDQDLVRTGLVMILGAQAGIEVIGEAADGIQAVEVATRLRPDVLLVDIRMPGLDGVEVTRRLAGPGRPARGRSMLPAQGRRPRPARPSRARGRQR
jgi:DNA-binding NarL/FixJ family response regulator